MITVQIAITLKEGILDAPGQTICHALQNLGHQSLTNVHIGKIITLYFNEIDKQIAQKKAIEACDSLLANPVIETYRILSIS